MDKHALANVCVVVEVFSPNAGVGAFGGFLGKHLCTSVRISNIDLGLGTMPGAMSFMSSAGASIPAAAGMPSAAVAIGMVKRW